jgi:hypothetical protein
VTTWRSALRALREHPSYTLMRSIARFATVRRGVVGARRVTQARALRRYLEDCESRMSTSLFADLNLSKFVSELEVNGVALGLRLPKSMVDEIRDFSMRNPCYADRDVSRGFMLEQRSQAERSLRKPILLAQYFNTENQCPAIGQLMRDPFLHAVAGRYLRSVPTLVGANLWWTFAVDALAEDRDRHAHLFHRDVDDFRFFKFFFYLTDVPPGEGAHVCVESSHRDPPTIRASDRWLLRRFSDSEIEQKYSASQIHEICGPSGTGFAENTLCIHKGRTPTSKNRLTLHLQFALFDYGVTHDRCDPSTLSLIA